MTVDPTPVSTEPVPVRVRVHQVACAALVQPGTDPWALVQEGDRYRDVALGLSRSATPVTVEWGDPPESALIAAAALYQLASARLEKADQWMRAEFAHALWLGASIAARHQQNGAYEGRGSPHRHQKGSTT